MRTFIICTTLVALTTTAGHASPGGRTRTGHQLQADFCKLLERGKVEPVMQMFGSNLKSEIDAPVLQRWLEQMASKLGRVRTIEQKTVHSNMRAGKHHLSTTAMVTCEKGNLLVGLRAVDGRIIGLDLESKQLVNWLDKPATTVLYEEMSRQFLREMLTGDTTKAFNMLHPVLRKQLGKDDFLTVCKQCRKNFDPSQDLTMTTQTTWMDEPQENKAPTLRIDIGIRHGEIEEACEMKIQFVGLKGHLLGFHFNK